MDALAGILGDPMPPQSCHGAGHCSQYNENPGRDGSGPSWDGGDRWVDDGTALLHLASPTLTNLRSGSTTAVSFPSLRVPDPVSIAMASPVSMGRARGT